MVNAALAPFANADASIFDALASACTVQRGSDAALDARCVVEDGVEKIGQYGQVIGRVSRVSFIKAEWAPERADLVTLDGVTRKIEAIDSDDGLVVGVTLHG